MGFLMEYEKKRGKAVKAVFNTLRQLAKKHRRRLVELSLIALLILISMFAYLIVQRREKASPPGEPAVLDQALQEGVYHYRLDNFDRSEILLSNVFEHSKKKKVRSLASLYLGNLHFRKADFEAALDFYMKSFSLDRKNVFAYYNAAVASSKSGEWDRARTYVKMALSLREDFTPALLFSGNIHYGSKHPGRALSLYERGRGADPLIDYNLAMLLHREGKPQESLRILNEIVSDSRTPEVLRGICYHSLATLEYSGEQRRALDYLKAAIDVFPSNPELRFNAALILLREGQYEEAAGLLRTLKDAPGHDLNSNYYDLFGQALYRGGNYSEALALFSRLYEQVPEGWMGYVIGDLLLAQGDPEGAESFYRKAAQDPTQSAALGNLAMLYADRGEYGKALKQCDEYLKLAPQDPLPYLCAADINFLLGSEAEARESMDRALSLAGDKAWILDRAARMYLKHGRYANALQLYHRMESLEPGNDRAQAAIAAVYLDMGQAERAKKALIKVRNTTSNLNLYYTASLRLAQIENLQNTHELYNELIEAFPYRYEAYYNLAHAKIKSGDFEGGLLEVRRCLDSVPGIDDSQRAMLHTLAGIAYMSMGNMAEALRAFHLARDLDPGNEITLLNLKASGELLQ